MLRLLVFFILALCFRSSFAVTDYGPPKWDNSFATPEAACQASAGIFGYVFDNVVVSGSVPSQTADCRGHAGSSPTVTYTTTNQGCASGWTWVPARSRCEQSVAQCPSGKEPVNGFCEVPPPCTPDQTVGTGYIRQGSDPNRMASLQCSGQCEVVFDGFTGAGSTLEAGVKIYFGVGSLVTTGAVCSDGTPAASVPGTSIPSATCPPGEVMGTINGQKVCAKGADAGVPQPPQASASQATSTQVTSNPDGTTTTTTTDNVGYRNSDGSTGTSTTVTTRTCDTAGNCTATSDTTSTGAKPDSEKKSECELNPDASMCQELDTPPPPQIPGVTVNVSLAPQSGWGADNGTCPTLVHTVSLGNVDVFGLICQYAAGIRFAVIGFAGIMGALIFLGRTD